MGLRKPEPAAFRHIEREIGVPAHRILFFDDSLQNVEGARACGLQAVHVTSDETVRETIAALLPA
jgi:putative hydrolase of the HAD superfamily